MKRTSKNWINSLLLAGIVGWHALPLPAQTNDLEQTGEPSAASTNSATTTTNSAGVVRTNFPGDPNKNHFSSWRRGPVFSILGNATLAAGESADAVVAIGGSAKAEGKVQNAVVAVGGNAEASSQVGDAVVAVGGNATALGKVGDAVVAIAGNAEVQGEVGDSVVAVMGDVKIGPEGIVHGDVVAVGGKVELADGAQIKGKIVEVSVARYPILAPLKGVADWLRQCLFQFRLLAPHPGWYWLVVGIFFLLYFLIAVAVPRPVAACVNELTQRPATTFLLGLLTKILLPLIMLILAMTGIGMIVIPFIGVAIFLGALIGKVALFEYLGRQIFRVFGITIAQPVLALVSGFVFITLLYMVPILSLLLYSLIALWAVGVVVTAAFGAMRKETPPRSNPPPPAPAPASPAGFAASAAAFASEPSRSESQSTAAASDPISLAPPPGPTTIPQALGLPRANFWERMGAAFLDVILVSILSAVVGGLPLGFLVALAYFAGLWAWKGTTIGGIVLNLKVVRLDDQPMSFAVGLVRALASALSVIVLFLGFLWMIWDRDKQTWHDKIAGTVVVRTPRGMSLICL